MWDILHDFEGFIEISHNLKLWDILYSLNNSEDFFNILPVLQVYLAHLQVDFWAFFLKEGFPGILTDYLIDHSLLSCMDLPTLSYPGNEGKPVRNFWYQEAPDPITPYQLGKDREMTLYNVSRCFAWR